MKTVEAKAVVLGAQGKRYCNEREMVDDTMTISQTSIHHHDHDHDDDDPTTPKLCLVS